MSHIRCSGGSILRRGLLLFLVTQHGLPAQVRDEQKVSGERLGNMKASTPPEVVNEVWEQFCLAHFGAEKEPMVYEFYGRELAVIDEGTWLHASETSACIAWETNLPARAHVEYGLTPDCSEKTHPGRRPFYVHVHYLTDLKPKAQYHYRIVSVDERGNRLASQTRTFKTIALAAAVHVPGDLDGPPYILDRPGATYVVTEDITADGTAIEIGGANIAFDLNGHSITYHNKDVPAETFTDKWMSYVHKGAVGIKNFGHSGLKLLNGVIRQGAGNNTGNSESTGFIPVYTRSVGDITIAGITVDYHSPQNTGVRIRSGKNNVEVHHNVFVDRGCKITNRHSAAVRALSFLGDRGSNYRVHHNLVKRTRQMGLLGADVLHHNEVYVDSWSVNSFALSPWKVGGKAHHNRVFGTGVNVQGFGWGESNIQIRKNLIHLEGINTGKNRGKEGWGDQDSMNGLRVTNYGKGGQKRNKLRYSDNLVVIKCRGGSQARGTEFFSDVSITDLLCRDVTLKVEAEDEATSQVACVVTHGHPSTAETALPVTYLNATLVSNLCNVRFGDYYGKGSNHHFINCKFIRTGNDKRYHTFIVDGAYWSTRHVLLDCEFGPGTRYDDVFWKRTSRKSFYSIKWTLTLKSTPGADVTIKNKQNEVEFRGRSDKEGIIEAALTQCDIRMPEGAKSPCLEHVKHFRTPHTISVLKNGKKETLVIEMTQKRRLDVAID